MAVKKQLDFEASDLPEAASDWFRQFLKHLELFMVETGQVAWKGEALAGLYCIRNGSAGASPSRQIASLFRVRCYLNSTS